MNSGLFYSMTNAMAILLEALQVAEEKGDIDPGDEIREAAERLCKDAGSLHELLLDLDDEPDDEDEDEETGEGKEEDEC